MSRRRHKVQGRRSYDTSIRPELCRRQRRRANWTLLVCGVLALLVLGAMVWHMLSDVMTDIVVFLPSHNAASRRWVKHLRSEGFWVQVVEDDDPDATRHTLLVPDRFASPYTAVTVNPTRYVISGPVPADAIAKILAEQPDIAGLAVLDSPPGAPGIDTAPGAPYEVWAFGKDGRAVIYQHRKDAAQR